LRVCNDQDSLADRIYCVILSDEVGFLKGCHDNHTYEGISGNEWNLILGRVFIDGCGQCRGVQNVYLYM
jgi:hypothetical protein